MNYCITRAKRAPQAPAQHPTLWELAMPSRGKRVTAALGLKAAIFCLSVNLIAVAELSQGTHRRGMRVWIRTSSLAVPPGYSSWTSGLVFFF